MHPPCTARDIKIAYIKNMLELEQLFVSNIFREELESDKAIQIIPGVSQLQIDDSGMLQSPFKLRFKSSIL